ncbi:MAG: hypothetical protein ACREFM_24095 [Hypericibacter sp.]
MTARDQAVAGYGGVLLAPCAEKAGVDVAYMHADRIPLKMGERTVTGPTFAHAI